MSRHFFLSEASLFFFFSFLVYSQNALLLQKILKHKEKIHIMIPDKYGLDFDFGTGYRDFRNHFLG